jgi:hypothetical protein
MHVAVDKQQSILVRLITETATSSTSSCYNMLDPRRQVQPHAAGEDHCYSPIQRRSARNKGKQCIDYSYVPDLGEETLVTPQAPKTPVTPFTPATLPSTTPSTTSTTLSSPP